MERGRERETTSTRLYEYSVVSIEMMPLWAYRRRGQSTVLYMKEGRARCILLSCVVQLFS